MKTVLEMGKAAREASRFLMNVSTEKKNEFLNALADTLEKNCSLILAANRIDYDNAEHLNPAMRDRLLLNEARIGGIVKDVRHVAELPDPVGEVFDEMPHKDGLKIHKERTPLGVVAVIYESRPNVTIDSASLLVKSGNAAILRGGKETVRTNEALMDSVREALSASGFPEDCVQCILSPDRALVGELLAMDEYVDMLIPRGGAGLHEFCRKNSRIPVITGGIGVCHIFLDESADMFRSFDVIRNAKVQRPTVCNALETLLVHQNIADAAIPDLCEYLASDGVVMCADPRAFEILERSHVRSEFYEPVRDEYYDREWLSLRLNVKVVDDINDAIAHIQEHGTGHSDSILTEDEMNADLFVSQVNSAAVYVNCSTRFTDGSELGLGAEIAISTQPLHARGPMALRELTTYKWVIRGDYNSRG
ncbi:MAG: glutamate-5-semialdehyde dehydrogenase [Anaerolineaceae bacterium]|nr:glutamate-5-semialdehyde dehydrogenase [Anaerolineaceae bacterium]